MPTPIGLQAAAIIQEIGERLAETPLRPVEINNDAVRMLVKTLTRHLNCMPPEGTNLWAAILHESAAPAEERDLDRLRICFKDFQLWLAATYGVGRHLIIDLESVSVILGTNIYKGFNPEALAMLKYLHDHPGEAFAGCRLYKLAVRKEGHQRTVARKIETLCSRFRKMIRGQPGQGYWFELR